MNQRNENNEKHGPWKGYYWNGQLWYKGFFINDNKIGYWVYTNKTEFYL
jgi:antitoxin component YwqK of YwqJK toxin-antitoxin module